MRIWSSTRVCAMPELPDQQGEAEISFLTQPRVVISGYYGFDNLGDELILHVFIEQLKQRNAHVTVLSNNPAKTASLYGVEAIHRLNLLQILDALGRSHLFISGGGGLFQDATGPGSSVYYGGLIGLAHFFQIPVCFLGQGVGPLTGGFARNMTRLALGRCDAVTVRDEASAELVAELTGHEPALTGDPVWLLNMPRHIPADDAATWHIGISLRPWPDLTEDRLKALAQTITRLVAGAKRPVRLMLFPFQPKKDHPVLERFRQYATETGITDIRMVPQEDILHELPHCHLLFGMRLHSLILGILSDVAVYGLIYDPKVRQLLKTLRLQGCEVNDIGQLKEADLAEYFNHYPDVNIDMLRNQAYLSFEILDRVLEDKVSEYLI